MNFITADGRWMSELCVTIQPPQATFKLEIMEKFARLCDLTGMPMNEGYVFGNGMFYIMDDQELLKKHINETREEYADMSDEDNDVMTMDIDDLIEFLVESDVFYYTEWDVEDEDYYYDSEGNEHEA